MDRRVILVFIFNPILVQGLTGKCAKQEARYYGDKFYLTICDKVNRERANEFCRSRGGGLAEIDKDIADKIAKLTENTFFYNGLIKQGADWIWETTRTVPTSASITWVVGAGRTKTCSVYEQNLSFRDLDCRFNQSFICQFNLCSASKRCSFSGEICKESTIPVYNRVAYKSYCECKPGYYGRNCTVQYCDYTPHGNPCKNGGTCKNEPAADNSTFYTCQCVNGYYGSDCTVQYCDYSPHGNPCQNGGTCKNKPGARNSPFYACECVDGYYGTNCSAQYCDYSSHENPCKNGGTCKNNPGTGDSPFYACQCVNEYRGINCTEPKYQVNSANTCKYHVNNYSPKYATFNDAKAMCENLSGSLAMDKNESIHLNIVNAIKAIHRNAQFECWIGGTWSNGEYRWLDGSAISNSDHLVSGQQHNENRCIRIGANTEYKWATDSCEEGIGWICEVPVENQFPCADYNPCKNGTCIRTGCQWKCECDAGYFKEACNADLIEIYSPNAVLGVAGDQLHIELKIVTYDGKVTVDVIQNGNLQTKLTDITNGTTNFTIEKVNASSAGNYVFSAFSSSSTYKREATTLVRVHVRAFIKSIGPKFIYSPVSGRSPSTVNCTVDGNPSPDRYGWYRNGKEVVNESNKAGVYQTFGTKLALLHIENAGLGDDGNFTCITSNVVNYGSNRKEVKEKIRLAVYGPPESVSPKGIPCSDKGEIKISWIPNHQTKNVNHKFHVRLGDALPNARDVANRTIRYQPGHDVIFNGLHPSTSYEVSVEVCPTDSCISHLNKSGNAVTGYGLPGKVNDLNILQIGNTVCSVTWKSVTSTAPDQVIRYNVKWLARIRTPVTYSVQDDEGKANVSVSVLMYGIKTVPNRVYTVYVSAQTCAGSGNAALANGTCTTERDAPDYVPPPTVRDLGDSTRKETRQVNIGMVRDESNGTISCLFVILFKSGGSRKITDPAQLNQLSENAVNENNLDNGYITLAIKRNQINVSEMITLDIGDNGNSECDIFEIESVASRERNGYARAVDSNTVTAKNIPLDFEGTKYTMITVTATPISNNLFKIQSSQPSSFTQGEVSGSSIIAVYVIMAIALVATAVGAFAYYKRIRQEKSADRNPIRMNSLDQSGGMTNDTLIYENFTPSGMQTNVPFKDLKEYYMKMQDNECMLFDDQYAELKRISKEKAPAITVGRSNQAMEKNRYKNILPYDDTRVLLTGEGMDSYINACYVAGNNKRFIAAQGPLPNTIEDFWRMIIEQECKIIVMLTKCKENGKRKCEKYWPDRDQEDTYGSYDIRNCLEKETGGIVERVFIIDAPEVKEFKVTQFHYLRWPDHGVPGTTSTFFRLHEKVMTEHEKTKASYPIVVHCSAGVGRTGTFIGFDILLGDTENSIDVYKCVMDMRKQRTDMVQTSDQYQMLHKLMLENYLFRDTDLHKNDFSSMRNTMNPIEEFENLIEAESFSPELFDDDAVSSTDVIIVRQPEDTERVTIDATFVEAYDSSTHFIASEGPTSATVEYFLRAIWDNGVDVVVMLNDPSLETENPESQYLTYWPPQAHDPCTFNSVTIQLIAEKEVRGTVERSFRLSRRDDDESMDVKQYQYLGWTSESPPESGDDMIELVKRIRELDLGKSATIMVHCTDGFGKTGVFIAVANIMSRLQAENRIDVFRSVKDLRDIRPGMVQTPVQYKFCCDIASSLLSQESVYANATSDDNADAKEVSPDGIYENVSPM